MTSRVSQKVAVSVVYVAAMFMTIMESSYSCANTAGAMRRRQSAQMKPRST